VIAALVLHGRLVTMDEQRPLIEDGALYIGADERIHAVQTRGDPPPAGFETATRVETKGCVYPGLIDLHSHVVYNVLPLWAPPGREEPFVDRADWPGHGDYEGTVSDPANALGALAGKAHLKYCEVKAVIGGTTAIQGSAKMAYPYEGWLVRNIEYETFTSGEKLAYQSALPLRSLDEYKRYRKLMDAGKAFIYHLSEGTDLKLIGEYELARSERMLHPRFCGIHCTALGAPQFEEWDRETGVTENGTIVWSPFSNLWLYRATTDVAAARDKGMRICLGSDWSPSGSKNLLGELKVADLWNRTHLAGAFDAQELCAMATRNPADALGWGDRIGRLRAGLHADVLVTTDRGSDPYRNLVESIESDVLFVAINGQPFYGTRQLMSATGATHAEPIKVGRHTRRVQLIYDDVTDADMSWAAVLADLAAAIRDPIGRYLAIEKFHLAGKKPPPWIKTDKPWDDPDITGKPIAIDVRIPPLDSLTHDGAYFAAVKRAKLHGGLLDGLREYYAR
jgi:cytosine/adenosine deaminase-related metal-dependent hydrolase